MLDLLFTYCNSWKGQNIALTVFFNLYFSAVLKFLRYLEVCRFTMSVKYLQDLYFMKFCGTWKVMKKRPVKETLIIVVCFLKIPIQAHPVLYCLKNNVDKTSERNTNSWGLLLSLSLKKSKEETISDSPRFAVDLTDVLAVSFFFFVFSRTFISRVSV